MNPNARAWQVLLTTACAVVVLSAGLAFAGGWPFRPSGGGVSTATADATYLRLDASNDPLTGQLTVDTSPSTSSGGVRFGDSATIWGHSNGDLVLDTASGADQLYLNGAGVYFNAHGSGINNGPVFYDGPTNAFTFEGDAGGGILFSGCTSCAIGEPTAEELEIAATWVGLDASSGVRFRDGGIMFTVSESGTNGARFTTGVTATADTPFVFVADGTTGSLFEVEEGGVARVSVSNGGDLNTEGVWPRSSNVFNNGTTSRKWLNTFTTTLGGSGDEVATAWIDTIDDADNQVDVAADLAVTGDLKAGADNTYVIGASGTEWHTAYVQTLRDGDGAIDVGADLVPTVTETETLGTSSAKWADVQSEDASVCKLSSTLSCAHALSDTIQINDTTHLVPEVDGSSRLGSTTSAMSEVFTRTLRIDPAASSGGFAAPSCAAASDQGIYLFNDTATDETNVCACLMDGTTSTFTRNLVLQVGASTKCN